MRPLSKVQRKWLKKAELFAQVQLSERRPTKKETEEHFKKTAPTPDESVSFVQSAAYRGTVQEFVFKQGEQGLG